MIRPQAGQDFVWSIIVVELVLIFSASWACVVKVIQVVPVVEPLFSETGRAFRCLASKINECTKQIRSVWFLVGWCYDPVCLFTYVTTSNRVDWTDFCVLEFCFHYWWEIGEVLLVLAGCMMPSHKHPFDGKDPISCKVLEARAVGYFVGRFFYLKIVRRMDSQLEMATLVPPLERIEATCVVFFQLYIMKLVHRWLRLCWRAQWDSCRRLGGLCEDLDSIYACGAAAPLQ